MAREARPKAQPEVREVIYAAFAYKNGTGEPVKVFDEEKYNALLKNGYSDCPTKAKGIKPESKKA